MRTPRKTLHFYPSLNYKQALVFSFVITGILLVVEFISSKATNSLLLYSVFLVQLSLTFFLFRFFLKVVKVNIPYVRQLQLAGELFNGFLLIVLSGYLFNEAYFRWSTSLNNIFSLPALSVAFVVLVGNYLLLKCLSKARIMQQTGRKIFSYFSVIFGSFFAASLTAMIIHYTDLFILDTLLSLLLGIPIFFWAAIQTIHAYWQISEMSSI